MEDLVTVLHTKDDDTETTSHSVKNDGSTWVSLYWNPSPSQFEAYKKREAEMCLCEMERWGVFHPSATLFTESTIRAAQALISKGLPRKIAKSFPLDATSNSR